MIFKPDIDKTAISAGNAPDKSKLSPIDILEPIGIKEYKEKVASLDYIIGRNLLKSGLYLDTIGTEKIGYFDPLKVIFQRFDQKGNPILIGYTRTRGYATVLFPDCTTKEEQIKFVKSIKILEKILKTYIDLPDFLNKIEFVDETKKFIMNSTVMPFFEKYSKKQKPVMIENDVALEVYFNSLLNFLCNKIIPELKDDQYNLEELKKITIQIISIENTNL
jgi:hypothetical protein